MGEGKKGSGKMLEDREFSRCTGARRGGHSGDGRQIRGAAARPFAPPAAVREDAEECVNDTYLGAWNAIPPARPAHFFAFLAKLCRNLACNRLDWLNAAKRRADVVSLTDELAACVPGADGGREQALRELGGLLSDFLRGLPQESRLFFCGATGLWIP